MPLYALGEHQVETPPEGEYWVAPSAQLIGRVVLKRNASVWFNAVLRGDNEPIIVGESANVQDGAILHTDMGFPLDIGAKVTIGHRAMLHGCTIGESALIGIGATVLNGAVIGKACLIGAHALVTEGKSIPEGTLAVGAPAKPVRDLTADEIALLDASAEHYVENARRFARELEAAR
ncbi:MAG: gamma carbonic anhydrase family protein [Maricaulaceae bacterium]